MHVDDEQLPNVSFVTSTFNVEGPCKKLKISDSNNVPSSSKIGISFGFQNKELPKKSNLEIFNDDEKVASPILQKKPNLPNMCQMIETEIKLNSERLKKEKSLERKEANDRISRRDRSHSKDRTKQEHKKRRSDNRTSKDKLKSPRSPYKRSPSPKSIDRRSNRNSTPKLLDYRSKVSPKRRNTDYRNRRKSRPRSLDHRNKRKSSPDSLEKRAKRTPSPKLQHQRAIRKSSPMALKITPSTNSQDQRRRRESSPFVRRNSNPKRFDERFTRTPSPRIPFKRAKRSPSPRSRMHPDKYSPINNNNNQKFLKPRTPRNHSYANNYDRKRNSWAGRSNEPFFDTRRRGQNRQRFRRTIAGNDFNGYKRNFSHNWNNQKDRFPNCRFDFKDGRGTTFASEPGLRQEEGTTRESIVPDKNIQPGEVLLVPANVTATDVPATELITVDFPMDDVQNIDNEDDCGRSVRNVGDILIDERPVDVATEDGVVDEEFDKDNERSDEDEEFGGFEEDREGRISERECPDSDHSAQTDDDKNCNDAFLINRQTEEPSDDIYNEIEIAADDEDRDSVCESSEEHTGDRRPSGRTYPLVEEIYDSDSELKTLQVGLTTSISRQVRQRLSEKFDKIENKRFYSKFQSIIFLAIKYKYPGVEFDKRRGRFNFDIWTMPDAVIVAIKKLVTKYFQKNERDVRS